MRQLDRRREKVFVKAPVLLIAAAAIGVVMPSAFACAANRVWVRGAGTGIWSFSSNWSPAGPPQPGDSVFVTAADSFSKIAVFDSSSFGVNNSFPLLTI